MAKREGELRLSPYQASKTWDRAFATTWHEIGEDHPSRSALERFVNAGYGGPEVRDFIRTGHIDVTVGMPRSSRYQQAPEGTVESNPVPDINQSERMHQIAASTGQPVAGSL